MSNIKLFQANNHSEWNIRYSQIDLSDPSAILVIEVIVRNYKNLDGRIINIEKVNEVEINSSNFKVLLNIGGDNKAFLLRKYSTSPNIGKVITEFEIISELRKDLGFVPVPIKNDAGEYLSSIDTQYFVLFEFIVGNHFRGEIAELENVALGLGLFDAKLDEIKLSVAKTTQFELDSKLKERRENSIDIWHNIFERAANLHKEHPTDSFYSDTMELKDEILELYSSVKDMGANDAKNKISHWDLHPHNLLTEGNNLLAILDFDSLVLVERIRAIAFALHRLVRQHIVYTNPIDTKDAIKKAKSTFISAYRQHGALPADWEVLIPDYIKHEALSRLIWAMKTIYFDGNEKRRQELYKQTSFVMEASYFI